MAALVAANAIWGGSVAATVPVLAHVPPATLAFLRAAVALAVLWPLVARAGLAPARGREPALLGLTGVALFGLFQNAGLHFASAATATLIQGAIPGLTALLAARILGERLGGRRLAGIFVSLVGVAGLVLHVGGRGPGIAGLGALLPLASAVSFAVFAVLGRRTFASGVLPVLAGGTRYATVALLPAASLELAIVGIEMPTARDLLLLLYLGSGCSALAFALAAYGLRHLEAGQTAVFGNLKPLVGLVCAAFLLGTPPSASQLEWGALVLAGVWLATGQRPAYSTVAARAMAGIRRMVGDSFQAGHPRVRPVSGRRLWPRPTEPLREQGTLLVPGPLPRCRPGLPRQVRRPHCRPGRSRHRLWRERSPPGRSRRDVMWGRPVSTHCAIGVQASEVAGRSRPSARPLSSSMGNQERWTNH